MFSGRMPVRLGPNDKDNLSFFLATHRSTFDNQNDSKLVLVLNECSSNLGILHEHGPYIIETAVHDSKSGSSSRNSKYNLKRNPNSWSEVANVLFLELPIWERDAAKRDDSIKIPQLAGAVRNFIIQFVDVFPQFKGDQ